MMGRDLIIRKIRWKIYLVILYCVSYVVPAFSQVNKGLEDQLQNVITGRRAQVGIAVIINGKDTVTVNNEMRYPMWSVYKFHQALAVVHHLEQKRMPLSTSIHVQKEDLHPDTYSPLRDKYPQGNIDVSIKDLLTYTLQLSDNNACDICFKYIVGVKETDRYIRSLGIKNFSISATEEDMHRDTQISYQNWTSPLAAAKLLELFITRPTLAKEYQDFIERTMVKCETGKDRLVKPLLGKNVIIGHKTGTGSRNKEGKIIGINDIGFVYLPDGRRYSIAIFIKDSEETPEQTAEIISEISKVIYQYVTTSEQ